MRAPKLYSALILPATRCPVPDWQFKAYAEFAARVDDPEMRAELSKNVQEGVGDRLPKGAQAVSKRKTGRISQLPRDGSMIGGLTFPASTLNAVTNNCMQQGRLDCRLQTRLSSILRINVSPGWRPMRRPSSQEVEVSIWSGRSARKVGSHRRFE